MSATRERIIRFFDILERHHEFQNPTSEAKLQQLIGYCDLKAGQRVLDIGCGKGWLLRRMARDCDIDGLGLDRSAASIATARASTGDMALQFDCIEAANFTTTEQFDVVCCIGASFAIGTLENLLEWADAKLKPGGVLAVGDIFAHTLPVPQPCVPHFAGGTVRDMAATIQLFENDTYTLLGVSESSMGEWDRYTSMHSFAADQWLREHPTHEDAEKFSIWWNSFRRQHLFYDRAALGWALFVSRKHG